ncbi:TonB-dependent receptor [Pseudoalteromonas sp. NBT06-2]|uniref:TonB-dependent receptor n=1 Tax=Pseudoalteromonas sp. NBT06-2 TaxID=2025950 RepID=UPI001BB053D8|nr:TonB-dependent receptor [Pseudoalteromonas sp. NBT06-2]
MNIKPLVLVINTALTTTAFCHNSVYAEHITDKNTIAATDIEVIEVTARKWQENIIQSPVTVNLFSQINQMNLDNIATVSGNVAFEQSSVQTRTIIRGVSSYDTSLTEPVAYYYNDIALPLGGNQLPRLANLQTLEVIKGPQGSLYGRNSQAGVINLKSQKPSNDPTGFVSLTYGQQDGAIQKSPVKDISIYANNTIIDSTLKGNIYIAYKDEKGPFYNQYLADKKTAQHEQKHINGQLEWQTQDNTVINLFVLKERNDNGKGQLRYNTGPLSTGMFMVNYNTLTYDNNEIDLYGLTINHTFDDLMLTYITGISDYQRNFEADLDLSPAPIPSTLMQTTNKALSQEFRLTNINNKNIKWLIGAYLYQQDTGTDFTIGGSRLLARSQRVSNIEQNSASFYAQLDWQLFSKLSITLGGRIEFLEQDGKQKFINNSVENNYQKKLNTNEFLVKAGIKYQINSNHIFFASFAQGYIPKPLQDVRFRTAEQFMI